MKKMRKRSFKRKAAFLLALSMICSFPQAINAGAAISDVGVSQEKRNPVLSVNTKNTDSENPPDTAVNAVGRIDVSFSSALLLKNNVEFTVTLTDASGKKIRSSKHNEDEESKDDTIEVGNSKDDKISFGNLADGNYTLEVNAPGFAVYRQEIAVAQKLYSVTLTAGFCKGYDYEKDGLHPGVLMIGDVNNDGVVDDTDKDILVNTIDGTITEEEYSTDLDFDGSTNLIDLTFLSETYKEEKESTESMVETFITPASVTPEVPEDTVIVDGSPEEVLTGEKSVSLAPAGGGEISEENPVTIDFNVDSSDKVDGITFNTGSENPVADAEISVTYVGEDGEDHTITVPMKQGVNYLLKQSEVFATVDESGNIVVNLGSQVAIKKVALKITAMQNDNNLAEISKVEFVNDMESRIPAPEMDMPENLNAKAGSEQFVISWDPCQNVKGYEVQITQGEVTETLNAVTNSMVVSTFGGKELQNYTTYKVSVQSVNGSWKSGYCDSVEVTPKPTKRPDKPDNVTATGAYKSIVVKWKKMKDTKSYNVYYKLRDSDDAYKKISDIKENTYTIAELAVGAEYDIYVTGVNELGESPASLHSSAITSSLDAPEMPKYNMINRDENGTPGSAHIISATRGRGDMVDSELDDSKSMTAWGTVDNNPTSYLSFSGWENGGVHNDHKGRGLTYEFDQEYKIDTIAWFQPTGNMDFAFQSVVWTTADGTTNKLGPNMQRVQRKTDSKGRAYYMLTLPYAINAKTIQICYSGSGTGKNTSSIAEVYFYHYDTLMDEVMDLYTDDLHTVLRDDVTQQTIDDLRVKVNAPDEFGEENFNKAAIIKELNTAEKILKDEKLNSAIEVHAGITSNDIEKVSRGFSGLNAWQPLGVSLPAGEQVTVYVGHPDKKTGDSTNVRLICTQYNSEANGVYTSGANLLVGANTFTIPKAKTSSSSFEAGGALYIQYSGTNANDKYSIRISGGTEVPFLDLYKVTDEDERMKRAVEYIEKLDKFVPEMESLHNEVHQNSDNKNVKFAYDRQNCILGASDILLDTMMLSLPAPQILAGTGTGTVEERAETMLQSMTAMEEMMYLFYQHKGLNADAKDVINQIPKGHLNIRYQRMFSGAFMYASGNHIGIGWNSTSSLMKGVPIVSDENGKYISGNYFGWGIAHEIGHNINQGAYSVAEITNNYFSQLSQAKDTNTGMRFQYKNIYDKVTSGTKGNCSNIATQLGMYWQLHLAYDKGLNYKTYSDYNEQLENLFYARVDTYARTPSAAPAPNGIKLTLGNTDQSLMRLACAAANKNVLEFFERWGKTPDSTTRAYAEQFEKETRAIFFANDDSRIYALNGEGSVLGTDCSVSAIKDVSVNIGKTANQVNLKFTSTDIPEEDILGYEVIRCTISGGKVEESPVGFSTGSTFTDTVTTMNNRAVFYKVTLIDQYLNRSASFTTKMVKIEHDGSMDKTNWTISTDGLTAESVVSDATDEMPCEKTSSNPAEQAIDHDLDTVYTPKVTKDNAEIVIDFNQTLTATGLKYTAGDGLSAGAYEVYVKTGSEWVLTAEGTFNGSETVYFANDDDKYISTYSADAVKLVLLNQKNQTVSIAELDVLGATGDNVDFRRAGEEKITVIGTLDSAYKYGTNPEDVIPKDSLVFTGSYKGNPAYNVVLLYDDNGNIVGGFDDEDNLVAQQIILADVPDNSNIANVSNGTWIYWIEPEQLKNMTMPENVRVELYRVNNALTNEGQRLVSDSLFEEIPDKLPGITFGK